MPRKNPLVKPLNKLKDTALDAVKDPRAAADKVVEQARGTIAFGKVVVEGVAEQVAARTRSRSARNAPRAESAHLRPVPADRATSVPGKKQGDPVAPTAEPAPPAAEGPSPADVAKKAPAKQAAKKAAKKAPAKKVAKKAPTKKTAKKAPAKKAAAKKAESGPPGDKLPPRKQPPEHSAEQPPPPPHEPNPEADA